jgi:hydroxyacylglutathione hydrolase
MFRAGHTVGRCRYVQLTYARRCVGSAAGDIHALADGATLASYRVADFADLADVHGVEDVTVLDVRQRHEFDDSHIAKAINIPLHELIARLDEVPRGQVWVHCGTGYRASSPLR